MSVKFGEGKRKRNWEISTHDQCFGSTFGLWVTILNNTENREMARIGLSKCWSWKLSTDAIWMNIDSVGQDRASNFESLTVSFNGQATGSQIIWGV